MSFDIKNVGDQDVNTIEIVVPFPCSIISKSESDTKECNQRSVHGKLTSLSLVLINPLKAGDTLAVKIGFEVKPLKEDEEHLKLFYYKLLDVINSDEILNAPPICTEGITFCVILPESLRAYDVGSNAKCHKDKGANSSTLSQLMSDLQQFLERKEFFEEYEKIPIDKRIHEIFEWGNEQLPDIDKTLHPAKSSFKRCIHFKFKKKDGIRIPFCKMYLSYESIIVIIISAVISGIFTAIPLIISN